MQQSAIHITGKHIDVGQRLRDHIQETLVKIVSKYHLEPLEVHVVLEQTPHGVEGHVHAQLPHGMHIHGHGTGEHGYAAFDDTAHHIEARVRRYKKRLHDHHKHRDVHHTMTEAQSYILSADHEEEDTTVETPLIVAETRTEIPSLTVSEAVMRMDLEAAPVFVFRNKKHGEINVVYRRPDHHIGWIDPKILG